jgi:small subunit ribosomal protein S19
MSRSVWKNNFIHHTLLKKKIKKNLQVWSRSSVIPSNLENKKVFIHFGNNFRPMYIKKEHIGFKFGEFAYTRKKNFNRTKKYLKKKKK